MTAQLAGSGDGSVYAWSVRSGKEVFLGVDSVGYFNCIFVGIITRGDEGFQFWSLAIGRLRCMVS